MGLQMASCNVCSERSCEEIDFYLYTRSNPEGNKLDRNSLDSAEWSRRPGPLVVMVHGFGGNHTNSVNVMIPAILRHLKNCNIISIDYSRFVGTKYPEAVPKACQVGRCLASLINEVRSYQPFTRIWMIGHSMGVHCALYASVELSVCPDRITCLDPADAGFHNTVDNYCAIYVDVYITNEGIIGRNLTRFGNLTVICNNGVHQPKCECDVVKSHKMAIDHFAKSFDNKWLAIPCSSWEDFEDGLCPSQSRLIVVGAPANSAVTGRCVGITNPKKPYFPTEESLTDSRELNKYRKTRSAEAICPAASAFVTIGKTLPQMCN